MDQQITRVPAVERRHNSTTADWAQGARKLLAGLLQALLRALHRRAARPPSEPPHHLHKDIGLPEVEKQPKYWDHL